VTRTKREKDREKKREETERKGGRGGKTERGRGIVLGG